MPERMRDMGIAELPMLSANIRRHFHCTHVLAVALIGSRARGDGDPTNSDVDVVRVFSDDALAEHKAQCSARASPLPCGLDPGAPVDGASVSTESGAAGCRRCRAEGTHYADGLFYTVCDVTPGAIETWFTDAKEAVLHIAGASRLVILADHDHILAKLQRRAHDFKWTPALIAAARQAAVDDLVGWIEEVLKGLVGLKRNDLGRMLNARHGLSFGMTRVLQYYYHILVGSDNTFLSQVCDVLRRDDTEGDEALRHEWIALAPSAFGAASPPVGLRSQIRDGLRLFLVTVALVGPVARGNVAVEEAVRRVDLVLSEACTHDDDDE